MTKTGIRNWISAMRSWAGSGALAMALLFLGILPAEAQTYTLTVLHNFSGSAHGDGTRSYGRLWRDAGGNLYGTTLDGGASHLGVVFKLDSSGHETILHSFTGPPADGANPYAGLVGDSAGNLYGTTYFGGASNFGVVFKLDSTGHETVLHSFAGPPADGANPYAGLVRDSAGNLYGTTVMGGGSRKGVIFKLDSSGHETILHSFAGLPADGANPLAGLIRDSAGNLYGTTPNAGASNRGVVFKLDSTRHETVLYSFTGLADGANPYAGLIRDSAGNLYGTTAFGGNEFGVVFKLDSTSQETVLHSFGGAHDGARPQAGLVRDSAGNLYGTTVLGGASPNFGVVFKLDSTGHETVLHSFAGPPADGSQPQAELIRDLAGNLYGTTPFGGTSNLGVVFKLTP
jgi:uncharacterized repeat protein (TIGR03803 family)